jgi:hypothetical protein
VAEEDRTAEAIAHLQTAGREMIAAARAFLDVAEELVEDPKAGEALLTTLGDVARRVVPNRGGGGGDDDGTGGVEHIHID